jgi:hypothetical protein
MPVVTIEHTSVFPRSVMVNILPNMFFVASLYVLSITPIFRRASYSRCSYSFLIDSSQCLIYAYIITSEELGSMSYEGRKLKKIETSITNGTKNGFVPHVNLRSESANII